MPPPNTDLESTAAPSQLTPVAWSLQKIFIRGVVEPVLLTGPRIGTAGLLVVNSFVARKFPEQLAAVVLIGAFIAAAMACARGFILALVILAAILGADDILLGRLTFHSILIALVMGGLLIPPFLFMGKLLELCGIAQPIAHVVSEYFIPAAFAVTPLLLLEVDWHLLLALRQKLLNAISLLVFGLIAGCVGAVLALGIIPFIPALGVAGLSLGILVGATTTLLLQRGVFALWRNQFARYNLFTNLIHPCNTFSMPLLLQMLNVGWRCCLQSFSEVINAVLFSYVIGYFSDRALMAASPSLQWLSIFLVLITYIGVNIGTPVGEEAKMAIDAANNQIHYNQAIHMTNIRRVVWFSTTFFTLIATLLFVPLLIFATSLLCQFFSGKNLETQGITVQTETSFRYALASSIFEVIRQIFTGSLRGGMKDIVFVTILSCALMTGLPLLFAVGFSYFFENLTFSQNNSQFDDPKWFLIFRLFWLIVLDVLLMWRFQKLSTPPQLEQPIPSLASTTTASILATIGQYGRRCISYIRNAPPVSEDENKPLLSNNFNNSDP